MDVCSCYVGSYMLHGVTDLCLEYFESSSPDFINGRGQLITAANQVDALAQAQSIGIYTSLFHEKNSLIYHIVYLSIFITQSFNVGAC